MKRKHAILLCFVLIVLAGTVYQVLKPSSLDFSKDEEPFRSMAMPPRKVEGTCYMDGGSVTLHVVDGIGRIHDVTFPHDSLKIHGPHPTAFSGRIDDRRSIPMKNPERAKEIAIQLLRHHAVPRRIPSAGNIDENKIALTTLSQSPVDMAGRLIDRLLEEFR